MAGNRLAKGAELPDPDEAVRDFERKLEQPLNWERQRSAALRLVRSI